MEPTPNDGLNESLPRADSNRTLSDIIHEEGGGKKSGRFKDQLRRSNSGGKGAQWTSTVHVPASDIPINSNKSKMMARQPSTRMNSGGLDPNSPTHPDPAMRPSGRNTSMGRLQGEDNDSENEEEEEDEGGDDGDDDSKGAEEGEQPPVRMSLMSLLAETDAYVMDDDDEDEEEEDDGGGVAAYTTCCVCMVRHKGTAFVPCGHSFCRLCSRELVVDRENCPLCNNYILEILDIF